MGFSNRWLWKHRHQGNQSCHARLFFEPQTDDIQTKVSDVDVDISGTIGYDEFLQMKHDISIRTPMGEIPKAFHLFDNDETGKISFKSLRGVAKEIGDRSFDGEPCDTRGLESRPEGRGPQTYGSGETDTKEIKVAMRALGFEPQTDDIQTKVSDVDETALERSATNFQKSTLKFSRD